MGYWTESDLPFYHGLARAFPVADRTLILSIWVFLARGLLAARAPGLAQILKHFPH